MAKKKTAKKVAKKAVKKTAKKTAKKAPKKVAKKTAKKAVKKAPKKVAKKVSKKAAPKKTTKKVAKKAAPKKVAKKAAPKKVAKKAAPKKVAKKAAPKKVAKKAEAPKKVIAKKVAPKKAAASKKVEEKKVVKAKKEGKALSKKATTQIKEEIAEEVVRLSEDHKVSDIFSSIRMSDYFLSGSDECLEKGCDNPSTSLGFCRFHYIKNWKDIKRKQQILSEGKLQLFIEELVAKYPVKYIESILTDFVDEKVFFGALQELKIESQDAEFVEDAVAGEDIDDGQDMAFETKTINKPSFDD